MANSVFGTNLKIAMRNKDEYHTDNGKRKCTKPYKISDLATDIGYTEHAIHGWTKKDGGLPNSTMLKKIADILDVDTAFLLGEQVCQRNACQTICDVTELNETSAKVLSQLKGVKSSAINELLSHADFEKLALYIWQYTHSQNNEIVIYDTVGEKPSESYSGDAQKELMKYRVSEVFGRIIDDIFNSHREEAIHKKLNSILLEMRTNIESCIQGKNNKYTRKGLTKMVSNYLSNIRKLYPNYGLCKFSPKEIIDNFDSLKEKFM